MSAAVLLHGFTLTGRSWDPVVARLPPDVDARAPDLRGHGAARDVRPIEVAAVVDDVVGATPEGATLCGYSLGGRVALRAALDRSGAFGRLVLVGATAGIADPAERAQRRAADAALADRMEAMNIEAFADEWGALEVFATQPPEVRALAHADRLRNDPRALAAALRALGPGAMEPMWDRLGELALRVTLVAGDRDAKYVDLAQCMAQRIREADVVVVPGVGHAVQLEAPDAVAGLLTVTL